VLGSTPVAAVSTTYRLATWNIDATIAKDFSLWRENRVGDFDLPVYHVLNHFQPVSTLGIAAGNVWPHHHTSQHSGNMEFGLRFTSNESVFQNTTLREPFGSWRVFFVLRNLIAFRVLASCLPFLQPCWR